MKETRYSVAACRSDAAPGPANDRVHGDAIDHEAGTSFLETSAIAYGPDKVSYIEDSMGYHKMENPDIHEECISLHLYSPGIAECTTWPDASCFRCVTYFVPSPFLICDFDGKKNILRDIFRSWENHCDKDVGDESSQPEKAIF